MTNSYRWVQWNRHKRIYDAMLVAGVLAYLAGFVGIALAVAPSGHGVSPPVLLIRAFGTAAAILLHAILAVGPLARLSPRWAPVLYNRRHLGVTCFLLALAHAALAIGFYGGFGVINPVSAVVAGPNVRPGFELFGLGALCVLFVMASTSHDYWLAALGHRVWKSLHMLVYAAYLLLVTHIAWGAMQSEKSTVYPALLALGLVGLTTLHLLAARRERSLDAGGHETAGWIDLGSCDDIPDSRARVVCVRGSERIAVYRDADTLHAISGVCAHQGGPLGEGKIVGGCVTCPWHGYQYRAHDGCSPPPYTEKIETYQLRVEGGRVLLNPLPNPPGTPTDPVTVPGSECDHAR